MIVCFLLKILWEEQRFAQVLIECFKKPPQLIIAWSLGSLLLHRFLNSKNKNSPVNLNSISLLSVAPIFKFCNSQNPQKIVSLMQKGLEQNTEAVLKKFWKKIAPPQTDSNFEQSWITQALSYSSKQLITSLEFLKQKTSTLKTLNDSTNLAFWCNPQDLLQTQWNYSQHTVFIHSQAHLPFLSQKVPF